MFVALATVAGIHAEGVNLAIADCDLEENINISNVSALISYLLTDAWPE